MEPLTYIFDLDNTLCITQGNDYEHSEPLYDRIEIVNQLYFEGHHIIIDTGRGLESGIDWQEYTENQLRLWGVRYHELRVAKKLKYHYYVDDRAFNAEEFFE